MYGILNKFFKCMSLGSLLCTPLSNSWASTINMDVESVSSNSTVASVSCPTGGNSMTATYNVTYTIPESYSDEVIEELKNLTAREIRSTASNDTTADNVMMTMTGRVYLYMRAAPGLASVDGSASVMIGGMTVGTLSFSDSISPGSSNCPANFVESNMGRVAGACSLNENKYASFAVTSDMSQSNDENYNRLADIVENDSVDTFREDFSVEINIVSTATCTGEAMILGVVNAHAYGMIDLPSINF